MWRGQAERLVPMIAEVLEKGSVRFEDLEAVVATIGPGTFTGLRIGLSTAKSLGLALDIPVKGVTSLQAVAFSLITNRTVSLSDPFAVLIETRRKDFYGQIFTQDGHPANDPFALEIEELLETLPPGITVTGDAVSRFMSLAADFEKAPPYKAVEMLLPDPRILVRAGRGEFGAEIFHTPEPLYLRPPDVSSPKNPPRRLAEARS